MPQTDSIVMREYQRQWIAQRRASWLDEHGPCVRCGTWDQLEIDHVDPSQKIDHKVWSWSQDRRDAELEKCQVLCRSCHLQKSRENGEVPAEAKHGGQRRYDQYGCRCPECSAWKIKAMEAYKARRQDRRSRGLKVGRGRYRSPRSESN